MPLFSVSLTLWSGVSSFFGFFGFAAADGAVVLSTAAGGTEVVSTMSTRVLSSSALPLAMGFLRERERDGGRGKVK